MENQDKRNKGVTYSKGKSNQSTEGRSSARWDESMCRIFVLLCEEEIGKGNRPNMTFNTNGWKNMVTRFNEMTGKNYVYKQLRNHWDSMKKEWLLFRKLMNGETGIGWNTTMNSLDADDEWWERKIRENNEYSKFRNKDLTLLKFRYDGLISDVAATGERARASSQISANDIDDNDQLNDNNGDQVEIGDSDDIEELGTTGYSTNSGTKEASGSRNEIEFPSLSTIKRKYCEESSQKKKKVTGSASLKEDIQSLLHFVNKNGAEVTIGAAIEMLSTIPEIEPQSEFWNYACNLFSKKEMREIFACQPSHESRLSWLRLNYDQFKKHSG